MSIQAQVRTKVGTRRIVTDRRSSLIPAVICKRGAESLCINLDATLINNVCRYPFYYSKIHTLQIGDSAKPISVFIRDVHRCSITGNILHLDFIQVESDQYYRFEVPVIYIGIDRSPGIKRGGIMNVIHNNVVITCKPSDLPEKIIYDISTTKVGDKIKASDVALPKRCTLFKNDNVNFRERVLSSLVGKSGKLEEVTTSTAADDKDVTDTTTATDKKDNDTKETATT